MTRRPPKPPGVEPKPRFQKEKTPTEIWDKHFRPLKQSLKDGSYAFLAKDIDDTTVVVTATSMLDYVLKAAFVARFRKQADDSRLIEIFDGYGPLSTFDAKIRLYDSLDIAPPDTRHDLDLIKAVRNKFAHATYSKKFTDEDISSRCLRLKGSMQNNSITSHIEPIPKRHFVEACIVLFWQLAILVFKAEAEIACIADAENHKSIMQKTEGKIREIYEASGLTFPGFGQLSTG
jgi:DNA-binding MltR family transcriptional regulator